MAKRSPTPQTPAFRRRAIASDIMTWHYETPDRLSVHLGHDARFIPWMGEQGLNAFFYIRHTVDSRLKIAELRAALDANAVAPEYGGHVLPLLLPRDRFAEHADYFPLDHGGGRNPKGNLCVSNPAALELARRGASRYLDENPECALLHIWGADVWDGAWCRCATCAPLSPQLQYLAVVNAIAETLEQSGRATPLAWLAYHDTIEPDPAMRPRSNVDCEWAPRERCYSHAIDDADCAINPRYFASLKRYIELFEGRVHVFEYYADAILFGGITVATPSVILRDMQAYHALGIDSISCLTFGEHSWLAYPINLATFARATQTLDFEPSRIAADVAVERHPRCARQMTKAYEAIARASALVLDGGGDVMRPKLDTSAAQRGRQLREAHRTIGEALKASDHLAETGNSFIGEREIWRFSREILAALADYVEASLGGDQVKGESAINSITTALAELQKRAPRYEDTWAAYDLEWISEIWLAALHRRFGPRAPNQLD